MAVKINQIYTLRQLILYFFKLGYSGFGGPVALVGYMHRDLVESRKWISEEEYKEGLARVSGSMCRCIGDLLAMLFIHSYSCPLFQKIWTQQIYQGIC